MKKFILFSLCFVITGCLTPNIYKYPPPINKTTEHYSATLEVLCHKEMGVDQCTDFSVSIFNKTNNNIKINWNDSAIVKDNNSGQLAPSGTKFINVSEAKQNTIIPAGMNIHTSFVASDNVYYSTALNMWTKYLITPGSYSIVLAIENGDKKENIRFDFIVTK